MLRLGSPGGRIVTDNVK